LLEATFEVFCVLSCSVARGRQQNRWLWERIKKKKIISNRVNTRTCNLLRRKKEKPRTHISYHIIYHIISYHIIVFRYSWLFVWTHSSACANTRICCNLLSLVKIAMTQSRTCPPKPQLACNILPATQGYVVSGDIWNEKTPLNPSHAKDELDRWSNSENSLAVYLWRHALR
jgi:hypothetical protein